LSRSAGFGLLSQTGGIRSFANPRSEDKVAPKAAIDEDEVEP